MSNFSFSNSSAPPVYIVIPVDGGRDWSIVFMFAVLFFAAGYILGKNKKRKR
jgi:hypothetical protein